MKKELDAKLNEIFQGSPMPVSRLTFSKTEHRVALNDGKLLAICTDKAVADLIVEALALLPITVDALEKIRPAVNVLSNPGELAVLEMTLGQVAGRMHDIRH